MEDANERLHEAQGDLAAGFALLVVAAVGGWSLFTNDRLFGDYGTDPGPDLLPEILLVLLALGAIALIGIGAVGLWGVRLRLIAQRATPNRRALLVPALMVATSVGYTQAMAVVGFLEATVVFAVSWTIIIGVQDRGRLSFRSAFLYAAEGLAITVGVYLIFAEFIKVPLP